MVKTIMILNALNSLAHHVPKEISLSQKLFSHARNWVSEKIVHIFLEFYFIYFEEYDVDHSTDGWKQKSKWVVTKFIHFKFKHFDPEDYIECKWMNPFRQLKWLHKTKKNMCCYLRGIICDSENTHLAIRIFVACQPSET